MIYSNDITKFVFSCTDVLSVEKSSKPKAGIEILDWLIKPIPLIKRPNNNPDAYSGCGVYAVYFANEIIYIGSYLGLNKSKNYFSGDVVADRWWTHIGSMTMRSNRLHIAKRTMKKIHDIIPKDNKIYSYFSNTPRDSDLFTDTGNLSPFKRVLFASKHDKLFLEPSVDASSVLRFFSFKYFKLNDFPADVDELKLKSIIRVVEKNLISEYSPQCNSTYVENFHERKSSSSQGTDIDLNQVSVFFQNQF